jgi:hypothetical protein
MMALSLNCSSYWQSVCNFSLWSQKAEHLLNYIHDSKFVFERQELSFLYSMVLIASFEAIVLDQNYQVKIEYNFCEGFVQLD